MFALLVDTLVPQGHAFGSVRAPLLANIARVMLEITVCDMRLAWRCVPRPPRWLCRVARACEPQVLHAYLAGTGAIWDRTLRALEGNTDGFVVAHYMLCSRSDSYLGTTMLVRRTGAGIPQRLADHLRCLLRPRLKNGDKPRYRLLRQRLQQVRFLPTAVFATLQQALAAESYIIGVAQPSCNVADWHLATRARGGADAASSGTAQSRALDDANAGSVDSIGAEAVSYYWYPGQPRERRRPPRRRRWRRLAYRGSRTCLSILGLDATVAALNRGDDPHALAPSSSASSTPDTRSTAHAHLPGAGAATLDQDESVRLAASQRGQSSTRSLPQASEDDWARRESARTDAIIIGQSSVEYREYVDAVPREQRGASDPSTPDARDRTVSRRHWKAKVHRWRRQLRTRYLAAESGDFDWIYSTLRNDSLSPETQ